MLFAILVVLAEVIGVGICAMMGTWFGHFQTGFAWREEPQKEFSYHPLFMCIGLIFLYGNGILMYRILPQTKKLYVKILHTVFHLGAIVFAIVGLVAAFDSHNLAAKPIPNMYSMHSWIGIVVVSMFCLQWVLGLVAYLLPAGLPPRMKQLYMPLHVFFGVALLGLSAATCLMGIVERTLFQFKRIDYSHISEESILINTMGVLLVTFTVIVTYLVVQPAYKRTDQGEVPPPDASYTLKA